MLIGAILASTWRNVRTLMRGAGITSTIHGNPVDFVDCVDCGSGFDYCDQSLIVGGADRDDIFVDFWSLSARHRLLRQAGTFQALR